MSYYISNCPVCCGMLEIVIQPASKICSILCDECSAEWDNPENALKNINGYRESFSGVAVRPATIEEVKRIGWESYIKQD